jgi:hypothetical protein
MKNTKPKMATPKKGMKLHKVIALGGKPTTFTSLNKKK